MVKVTALYSTLSPIVIVKSPISYMYGSYLYTMMHLSAYLRGYKRPGVNAIHKVHVPFFLPSYLF